jgi:hypothetical protein
VNVRHWIFSLAHQRRKLLCAIDEGALRKNQWRKARAIGVLPLAHQWRSAMVFPPGT